MLEAIIKRIIENEGGYKNLYYDDGLETRAGITWRWNIPWWNSIEIFTPDDIYKATKTQIDEFYRIFAMSIKVYEFKLYPELAYSFVDHAINDGPPDGIRLLQNMINDSLPFRIPEIGGMRIPIKLKVDGDFGRKTLRALETCFFLFDQSQLVSRFNGLRRARYHTKYLEKRERGDIQHAINCLISWNNRV